MTKTKWEAGWLISQTFCQLLPWKPRVCCCLFYACCVRVMVYVCACMPVEARGQSRSGVVTKNASLAAQGAPRLSLHLPIPTAMGLQVCPKIGIFTWVPKVARHAFYQRSHLSSPKTKLLKIQVCVLQSPPRRSSSLTELPWTNASTLSPLIMFPSVFTLSPGRTPWMVF